MDSFALLDDPRDVAAAWDTLRRSWDPPLMQGYDFDAYVEKVAAHAVTVALYQRGELAGAVSFYANDAAGGVAYITNIAVHGSFAGHGLGEELLSAAARESRSRGMKTLRLEVRRTNARALALYRRFGFVEEPGDPASATVYMSMPLRGATT